MTLGPRPWGLMNQVERSPWLAGAEESAGERLERSPQDRTGF